MLTVVLTTNIPQWNARHHVKQQTHKDQRKVERGWISRGERGNTNEIETKEILTTNTTIYTTAKVSLPYTTIVNETER